ncbi:MAG: hypothetical protein QW112_01055 [Candidatus Micrarchaeia archaeon]
MATKKSKIDNVQHNFAIGQAGVKSEESNGSAKPAKTLAAKPLEEQPLEIQHREGTGQEKKDEGNAKRMEWHEKLEKIKQLRKARGLNVDTSNDAPGTSASVNKNGELDISKIKLPEETVRFNAENGKRKRNRIIATLSLGAAIAIGCLVAGRHIINHQNINHQNSKGGVPVASTTHASHNTVDHGNREDIDRKISELRQSSRDRINNMIENWDKERVKSIEFNLLTFPERLDEWRGAISAYFSMCGKEVTVKVKNPEGEKTPEYDDVRDGEGNIVRKYYRAYTFVVEKNKKGVPAHIPLAMRHIQKKAEQPLQLQSISTSSTVTEKEKNKGKECFTPSKAIKTADGFSRICTGQGIAEQEYFMKLDAISIPYNGSKSRAKFSIFDRHAQKKAEIEIGANETKTLRVGSDCITVRSSRIVAGLTPFDSFVEIKVSVTKDVSEVKTEPIVKPKAPEKIGVEPKAEKEERLKVEKSEVAEKNEMKGVGKEESRIKERSPEPPKIESRTVEKGIAVETLSPEDVLRYEACINKFEIMYEKTAYRTFKIVADFMNSNKDRRITILKVIDDVEKYLKSKKTTLYSGPSEIETVKEILDMTVGPVSPRENE